MELMKDFKGGIKTNVKIIFKILKEIFISIFFPLTVEQKLERIFGKDKPYRQDELFDDYYDYH